MRSTLFNLAFHVTTGAFVLLCALLSLFPGSAPVRACIRAGCRTVRWEMRHIMGIRVEVRGRIPRNQPVIIASKHQSWGDGFLMMAIMGDINFMIGNAAAGFPFVERVVRKSGATMVNSPGLRGAEGVLEDAVRRAGDDPRPLLIYPEGRLATVGTAKRYRKGVFLMYEALERPVVPVAHNLGLRWPKNEARKFPGPAVIEFLDPIPPGLPRDAFLPRLQVTIESRTRDLEAEGLAATSPETEASS